MAKLTNAQVDKIVKDTIREIDALHDEFKRELARLKAERRKIIADAAKYRDDARIKEILRSIK